MNTSMGYSNWLETFATAFRNKNKLRKWATTIRNKNELHIWATALGNKNHFSISYEKFNDQKRKVCVKA